MEAFWLKEISDIQIYFERPEAEESRNNRKQEYNINFKDYSARERISKELFLSQGNVSGIEVSPRGANGSDIDVTVPYDSFERLLGNGEIGDR